MADSNSNDVATSSGTVVEETKKIMLKSSDGEIFEVEEKVACESQIIKQLIEDGCADDIIPLFNVTGNILAKVLEYCKKHTYKSLSSDENDLRQWDKSFIGQFEWENLSSLVMAANFLNIQSLLDITTQAVADYIKDLSVERLRELFDIENDYTPKEEEAIRKEYAWAFE